MTERAVFGHQSQREMCRRSPTLIRTSSLPKVRVGVREDRCGVEMCLVLGHLVKLTCTFFISSSTRGIANTCGWQGEKRLCLQLSRADEENGEWVRGIDVGVDVKEKQDGALMMPVDLSHLIEPLAEIGLVALGICASARRLGQRAVVCPLEGSLLVKVLVAVSAEDVALDGGPVLAARSLSLFNRVEQAALVRPLALFVAAPLLIGRHLSPTHALQRQPASLSPSGWIVCGIFVGESLSERLRYVFCPPMVASNDRRSPGLRTDNDAHTRLPRDFVAISPASTVQWFRAQR